MKGSHDAPAEKDLQRPGKKKGPKAIALMLLAAFLAFAPPGTLIAGLALILGLVRYCSGASTEAERAPQTQATPSPTPSATPPAAGK